ncbi:TRAP transporter permease [Telmatospirillum sp. J64-1]|uniref:TRAP transporter permease n=1 Tax=Telmatospirillum sp. J64-1 TaxID=2502183 RepID=UPI00115D683E|nr:TRAP transporter permease [Telmatospirillum sp. J64-1]
MQPYEEPSSRLATRIIFLVAVIFSLFQIWMAAYHPLSSLVVRSIHVGFLLLLTFLLTAGQRGLWKPLDWGLGVLAFALAMYHWVFEADIIWRAGDPSTTDLVVGVVVIVLVFEAGRRLMGWALPTICGLFLAYALFGEYLPAPLHHRPYGFDQIIDHMFLGTEGIYGIPTYVSATYLFLFILLGSFLEQAGMVKLFTDFAMGTVGHQRGGPAKVSTVSSALMGTINGSGVANVVTTGQFTIPLMKRFGYRPEFAGAVEATASMGGQIMPPVMGAVAFIMAETLGVAYVEVVRAATVPALLYFATILWMVHLEAGKRNLHGLPKEECPNPWMAVRKHFYLLAPLVVLVFLLFTGYTPLFAGTVALGLTVVLILGVSAGKMIGPVGWRVLFWMLLGLAASAFFKYGIGAVFLLIGGLVVVNFFAKGGRDTLSLTVRGLESGARNALGVGVACVLVGTIIGTMTLTGLATTFARVIIEVAGQSLFLSLVLTMITCLILGMGIPTIPNYIITSSLVGPALLDLGVPLIVSHMFVFYFGIMADLTPPVALAAFAASAIAKAPALKIGVQCVRIAIAGFVVPYMAVYNPALLLQGDDWGEMGYMAFKALFAVCLWGAGSVGYLFQPMSWLSRAVATGAAASLVIASPISDSIGIGLGLAVLVWEWLRARAAGAGAKA